MAGCKKTSSCCASKAPEKAKTAKCAPKDLKGVAGKSAAKVKGGSSGTWGRV